MKKLSIPLDVAMVADRMDGLIQEGYSWPDIPKGWQLEFIAYPDGTVDMDLLHPVSAKWWSEDNERLPEPVLPDGGHLTAETLAKVGIPFMGTFNFASVGSEPKEPHLQLVSK